MPELPEVETIRRDLLREIKGLVFESVRVLDSRVIRSLAKAVFVRRLSRRSIHDIRRRGKAIVIDLGGSFLIVQLGMTGQLVVARTSATPGVEAGRDARVVFRLSKKKTLVYNDQRLFGRLTVVGRPEELGYIRSLGLEPLGEDFTVEVLRERLQRRESAIKSVLLDGKCVAGIGNIYASEILFAAGISPKRKASGLRADEFGRLWRAIRGVLEQAVRLRGTSMRNYRDGRGREGNYRKTIRVYGREGEPCCACGTPVRRMVQAQRSTFFCPECQT